MQADWSWPALASSRSQAFSRPDWRPPSTQATSAEGEAANSTSCFHLASLQTTDSGLAALAETPLAKSQAFRWMQGTGVIEGTVGEQPTTQHLQAIWTHIDLRLTAGSDKASRLSVSPSCTVDPAGKRHTTSSGLPGPFIHPMFFSSGLPRRMTVKGRRRCVRKQCIKSGVCIFLPPNCMLVPCMRPHLLCIAW